MLTNTKIAKKMFKATLAPDLDTFDDLMFAALRAMVACLCKKSDKGLSVEDFLLFLNQLPYNQRNEMVGNILSVTNALNRRLA